MILDLKRIEDDLDAIKSEANLYGPTYRRKGSIAIHCGKDKLWTCFEFGGRARRTKSYPTPEEALKHMKQML